MTSDDTTPPAARQTDRPTPGRGANGRFRATTASAQRDREAASLWAAGASHRQIAAELGYASHRSAADAVERGLDAIRRPDAEVLDAAKARLVESRRVAMAMEAEALEVMGRRHVAFNQKGVIYDPADPEGKKVLVDSGPKLAAIDRVLAARKLMLALDEREAKLQGLDAPDKINLSGGVTYQVVGVPGDDLG